VKVLATGGLYNPARARILERTAQTRDTFLYCVELEDETLRRAFDYQCGQFAELSIEGVGECPISITSSPAASEHLEFCIRAVGEVTSEICALGPGDRVGIRGPLGRPFPLESFRGRDILFVAGGIGLAPLRSLIGTVLADRNSYGSVDIVYGARSSGDLCFRSELERWAGAAAVHVTVDREDGLWQGHVGLVPDYVDELGLRQKPRTAVVCGPPIMIRIELGRLDRAGWKPAHVWTTLERRMRCGVGKCARCLVGSKYVCLDGPVFNMEELGTLPWDEE
jgi:sulfhydrogenase subunit gamma (sulfur reductase)